jgi:hypothetical protein
LNAPPGNYVVVLDGSIGNLTGARDAQFRITDGTNNGLEEIIAAAGAGSIGTPTATFYMSYSVVQSDVTLQIQGRTTAGGTAYINGTTGAPNVIKVYRFPTLSETIVRGTNRAPTVQRFTSGSGTYTRPNGVVMLKVRMAGGGGGGRGSSGNATAGSASNGTNTTFGTSLLTANNGTGAATGLTGIGAGGSFTVNSPAINLASSNGEAGSGAPTYTNATSFGVGGSAG